MRHYSVDLSLHRPSMFRHRATVISVLYDMERNGLSGDAFGIYSGVFQFDSWLGTNYHD
jgi:hypothetical protein